MKPELQFQKNFREWLVDKPKLYKAACQHFHIGNRKTLAAYEGTWEEQLKYFQDIGLVDQFLQEKRSK